MINQFECFCQNLLVFGPLLRFLIQSSPLVVFISMASQLPLSFSAFHNIIDGKLERTKETRHGINPSTLEANPGVPVSTRHDVDRAVQAARRAFASWSRTPIEERRAAVIAFSEALASYTDVFARMLTKEQGRPVSSNIF